jgi:nucleoside-diphosphate-sugar epimerase
MRALVTGATGFIGGALARKLVELGWDVRLLTRASGKNLPTELRPCRTFLHEFGRDGAEGLEAAVDGCDVVFHAAAIRNRWGTPPSAYDAVNVAGTSDLMSACRGRAGRFVYLSSVGVHGYPGVGGIDETNPVAAGAAAGGYHRSKIAAERLIWERGRDTHAVVVRPTITYGPGDETGMVTRLIEMMAARRFVRIGPGRNHIHLTYIDDLAGGLVLSGTHPAAVGQTFILSGPAPVRVASLLDRISALLGMKPPSIGVPVFAARVAGAALEALYSSASKLSIIGPGTAPPLNRQTVMTLCAERSFSHRKASEMIGFFPVTGLGEGLPRTVEWLRADGRVKGVPFGRTPSGE